jgi:hypothetical protein
MSDHGQSRLSNALNKANWRSDMDSVILELMRRRTVEGLIHFARLVKEEDREYIVECELWTDVKGLKHKGCLMYFGPPEGDSLESGTEFVPPRLSTMDFDGTKFGTKLVVHNMPILLGEEHLNRLRQESELLRDGSLYMLGRQATLDLQRLLWKLQGYMSWEEPAALEESTEASANDSRESSAGRTIE